MTNGKTIDELVREGPAGKTTQSLTTQEIGNELIRDAALININDVKSIHDITTEEFWTDGLLEQVVVMTMPAPEDATAWRDVFQAFHVSLKIQDPGKPVVACMLIFLQHGLNPFAVGEDEDFGFFIPQLDCKKPTYQCEFSRIQELARQATTLFEGDKSV